MKKISVSIILSIFCLLLISPTQAKTIYVFSGASGDGSGTDWANACQTITAGLTVAASGDVVYVKSSTYSESIILKEGVVLYGGFPVDGSPSFDQRDWIENPVEIDAGGMEADTVVAVTVESVFLDGFTITGDRCGVSCSNSSLSISNCTISDNMAGGVECSNNSSLTLTDCSIINNQREEAGGGIYCASSDMTVTDCTIADNLATDPLYNFGGGVYCVNSSPNLNQCTISGNIAAGFLSSGFTVNYGAGMYCANSMPILTGCTIIDNLAGDEKGVGYGGGFYCLDSTPELTLCIISQNSVPYMGSSSGGGIDCSNSSLVLNHCTISSNSSVNHGGGMDCDNSSLTLNDCVITKNSLDQSGGWALLRGELFNNTQSMYDY